MTAILTCDVYSCFHQKLYAKKGSKVTVIAEHGNVLIVEGANKQRFSVTICELKINNTNG